MRRSTTPTEVSSPRKPESGNPTSCRKSKPTSLRSVPAGTVSVSTVCNGRSCAKQGEAITHIAANKKMQIDFLRAMAVILRDGPIYAKRFHFAGSCGRLFRIAFQSVIHRRQARRYRRFGAQDQLSQRSLGKSGFRRRRKLLFGPTTFRPNRQRNRFGGQTGQKFPERLCR